MVILKEPSLDKNHTLELIHHYFRLFESYCNNSTIPNIIDLGKIFSKDFQITSNHKLGGTTLIDYIHCIKNFQKRYSHCEISKPLTEPLFEGNKVVLYYDVTLMRRNGKKTVVHIMAIGKIEDQKLSQWTQVAHQKGEGDWDS